MTSTRMKLVIKGLDWQRFRDPSLLDRIPLLGPAASVLFEYGCYEGNYVRDWLGNELAALDVTTCANLRCDDWRGDPDDDQGYKLVVLAADITRGELIRLPWDYRQYGLDPDGQLVVDAVRASISIPIFFEPVTLRHANGESSTLVDGGVVSNYPIEVFDRTDGHQPRWPTLASRSCLACLQPMSSSSHYWVRCGGADSPASSSRWSPPWPWGGTRVTWPNRG
jgi:NTE family protein